MCVLRRGRGGGCGGKGGCWFPLQKSLKSTRRLSGIGLSCLTAWIAVFTKADQLEV